MPAYTDEMDADEQISMEEQIARTIFDRVDADEETCAELGREILLMVLANYRDDLVRI